MVSENVSQIVGGFKLCTACLIEKPISAFALQAGTNRRPRLQCRTCVRTKSLLYERAYRKRRSERERLEREKEPRIDANGRRRCSACKVRKSSDSFPPNAGERDGLSFYCRACVNRKAAEQRAKPKTREYRRVYMRVLALKRYGLTLDDFDALVSSQDGKCAICEEELVFGVTGGGAVDHDHETGKVRGLLCRLCNVGVGHFRENTRLLAKAITYLQK